MGSGASSSVKAAVAVTTDADLKAVFAGLSAEDRAKLTAALKPSKKVLMVLSSAGPTPERPGAPGGWYLPEVAHPHKVFTEAGVQMTFGSPKGGAAPVQEDSVAASKDDKVCMGFLEGAATKALVDNTKKLSDVKSADFDAVFFTGGYGTMWDFPDDADVQRIAKEIYEQGGIVSGVCHGPVALINVKLSDGTPLVKDKDVTAFTNGEEDAVKLREVVPYTCEDKLKALGGKFSDGGVFQPNVVVSGRLITGQNPPSSEPCAKAVLTALNA